MDKYLIDGTIGILITLGAAYYGILAYIDDGAFNLFTLLMIPAVCIGAYLSIRSLRKAKR